MLGIVEGLGYVQDMQAVSLSVIDGRHQQSQRIGNWHGSGVLVSIDGTAAFIRGRDLPWRQGVGNRVI